MTESVVRLRDLGSVIRSKNAGPFVLTLDVFFQDEAAFQTARDHGGITRRMIAELYQVPEREVIELCFIEPAWALKISLRRWVPSAAPGDTDVFGAQQHVPLMNLALNLPR